MKEHGSRRTVKRLYNDHPQCKVPRITNCRIFAQPSAAHGAAIALATSVTSESFSSSPFICSASARDTFHGRGRFHVPVATVAKSASALTSSSACDDAHLPRTETRGSTADPNDQTSPRALSADGTAATSRTPSARSRPKQLCKPKNEQGSRGRRSARSSIVHREPPLPFTPSDTGERPQNQKRESATPIFASGGLPDRPRIPWPNAAAPSAPATRSHPRALIPPAER